MRRMMFIAFLIFFPIFSFSDPDCSDRNDFSDSEYILICESGRDHVLFLKGRVRDDIVFFNKWRSGKDHKEDSFLIERDIAYVEKLIEQAELAIQKLAHVECVFDEYPGFTPSSGSSALNYGLCRQTIEHSKMVGILEGALRYMSVVKPSFDCGLAMTEIEMTICESESLSSIDRRIYQEISRSDENLPGKYNQYEWMDHLESICLESSNIEGCLDEAMNERLKGL